MARAAEFAVVAIDGRLERRAVAGNPTGNARTHPRHHARRLMPQDHRILARRIAYAAFGVRMQIRTAYADGVDADLHLTRTGIGQRRVDQPEPAQSAKLGYARVHGPSSAGGRRRVSDAMWSSTAWK